MRVLFAFEKRIVVNLEQVVINPSFNEDSLQNQIEILRSTKLIENVIAKLKLDRSAIFNPLLVEPEDNILTRISGWLTIPPEIADFLTGIGILKPPPPAPDATAVAERNRIAIDNNVLDGLSLNPIRGSKVIQISYLSPDPDLSARITNAIAEQYIIDQLDSKLDATRTATNWLSTRVDELKDRVEQAESAVETARAEQSIKTGQSLEITQQQLKELNASLSVMRNDTLAAGAAYDRLRSAVEQGKDFGAIEEFRQSNMIQSYREQLAQLESQKIALEATIPSTHPTLVRLNRQIEELNNNINDEAKRVVAAAQSTWVAAQEQEKSIAEEVRRLESLMLQQSRNEIQIRQLEREAQASRVLYENFLSRLKETTQQEDLQSADARVLSPAERPLYPESQAKKRTIALALVIGVLLGGGIVFLHDRINNSFRSPMQVEELTGLKVIGTIPAIGRRMHRHDVIRTFKDAPKSALAESVRNLRTSILFSNVDNPPKVVMFTSSVPREAKSTTSTLIAIPSRQMGKSAIIVDCDLRLPTLAGLLDANDDKPGLLSVVEGGATLAEAIHEEKETGLHVLMTKASEPRSNINAADILSSKRFEKLISELREIYDLVILDTPPALVVADGRCPASGIVALSRRTSTRPGSPKCQSHLLG